MTVVYKGLGEVQHTMTDLSKLLDSITLSKALWMAGEQLRWECQRAAYELIYSTPESPNYRRTSYLRNSLYLTMLRRTDRAQMHANAYRGAEATYPNRPSNPKTYKLVPHIPYPTRRAIRLTAGAIYADEVEYGNAKMGPRPFMRNGSASGARAVNQVLEDEIAKAVRKLNAGATVK